MNNKPINFFPSKKPVIKPSGYINLWLPATKNGSRRKLGTIALRNDNPAEKQLIQWLKEDSSRIGMLLHSLSADFQEAKSSAEQCFDLDLIDKNTPNPS